MNRYRDLIFVYSLACLMVVMNPFGLSSASEQDPVPAPGLTFTDVTRSAGIDFKHHTGAFGKKYLPETTGSGCAFLDFDHDGHPDILLINGMDWPGHEAGGPHTPALYRNQGDGTFRDVTKQAGLAIEMYGMGCGIADVDNDGDDDLYLTNLGKNRFFLNNGDGTFTDATDRSGLGLTDWSTSCAWLDYDNDGWVDLFVGNYVVWSEETDIRCTLDGINKSYCTPESYTGVSPRLYRNRGNGTFEDVTQSAGITKTNAKTLGNVVFDINGDGWLDIAVANDTEPDYLYQNNGDGTFMEVGVMSGMAFSESGMARAGMGMDASDYDNQGRFSLAVGNFSNEMIGVYRNEGNGLFVDVSARTRIGIHSLPYLTFGLFFFDADLDGTQDLLCANGHVEDRIELVQRGISYRQPPQLYFNRGDGTFTAAGASLGKDFARPMVGRGSAYADIDEDGDLDVLITSNNESPHLFRNDRTNTHHWIRFKLQGTKSNRNAIGATVKVHTNGTTQQRLLKAGNSYCSQSEWPVTFGLGDKTQADKVEITWPKGLKETWQKVPADKTYLLVEGQGDRKPQPL